VAPRVSEAHERWRPCRGEARISGAGRQPATRKAARRLPKERIFRARDRRRAQSLHRPIGRGDGARRARILEVPGRCEADRRSRHRAVQETWILGIGRDERVSDALRHQLGGPSACAEFSYYRVPFTTTSARCGSSTAGAPITVSLPSPACSRRRQELGWRRDPPEHRLTGSWRTADRAYRPFCRPRCRWRDPASRPLFDAAAKGVVETGQRLMCIARSGVSSRAPEIVLGSRRGYRGGGAAYCSPCLPACTRC